MEIETEGVKRKGKGHGVREAVVNRFNSVQSVRSIPGRAVEMPRTQATMRSAGSRKSGKQEPFIAGAGFAWYQRASDDFRGSENIR
jgi:hypothetical protein